MKKSSLSPQELLQEKLLLHYCQEHQGPAISVLNVGRSNNATTYRDEFCDASADLFKLYRIAGIQSPITRMVEQFQTNRIRTCRGNEFDAEKATYFFDKFLTSRIRGYKFIVLAQLEQKARKLQSDRSHASERHRK